MTTRALFRLVAVTALLAAGCGSGSPPSSGAATPTSSISTTASLAIFFMRGSDQIVVQDLTDVGHPTTLSTFGAVLKPRFVSAATLSYTDGNSVFTVPLSGSPRTMVATSDHGIADFAWSPNGKTLAYETIRVSSDAASALELHLVSDGKDRIVGSMPGPPAVYGCETQECADRLNSHFAYSPDGQFISAAQNLRPAFRLWTADGVDRSPAMTDTPFMLVWSGANLYFRDSKGVEVYRNGTVSLTLQGVAWIRPKASPAGDQILYEARDSSG